MLKVSQDRGEHHVQWLSSEGWFHLKRTPSPAFCLGRHGPALQMNQGSPAGAWAGGHLAPGGYGLLPWPCSYIPLWLHQCISKPCHTCTFHTGLAWLKKYLLGYFPERKDHPLDWQDQEGRPYLQGYLSFIAQNRFHPMHQARWPLASACFKDTKNISIHVKEYLQQILEL